MTATATVASVGTFHPAIALDAIVPSKTNPRKHFDPEQLAELAASIREKGVIEPIIVRKVPLNGRSRFHDFEIVAGERRWRASKDAGVATIPAIERELDDTAVLEIQVIENGQREDVHELEEADGYKSLMDSAGYDVATIAEKVGKSQEYVYARLKLLNLIEPLQGKFLDGTITAGHAILFARLPAESQTSAAKRLFDEEFSYGKREKYVISVRELNNWIQNEIQMDLSKAVFDKEDPKLVPAAGACTSCPKRTGAEPHLWPELGKKDHCTDNACFNKKINAAVEAKVSAGDAVRLTTDWGSKKKAGHFYLHDQREIKPGTKSCEHAVTGIIVDGHQRGETKRICSDRSCKVHFGRNGSGATRHVASPAEQYESAKVSISQSMDAEHRRRIYEAVLPKLEAASVDVLKLAKPPVLQMILRAVYSRLDSTACAAITEELKLRKASYSRSVGTDALSEYSKKLDAGRLLALIARVAFRGYSMGFVFGDWEHDKTKVTKQFGELAQVFGVKLEPIQTEIAALKKAKLSKAKERMESAKSTKKSKGGKLHTSAKRKSKTDDDDGDAFDRDPTMDDGGGDYGDDE